MKIVMAQLNYIVGDFQGNSEKIISVIKEQGQNCDMIVFSELCLSGYYPMDLLDRSDFIVEQNNYLQQIKDITKDIKAAVVLGYIDENIWSGKPYHNSLGLFQNGRQIFTYHKKLLPTYNIFDEARYFEPGNLSPVFEYNGYRIGVLICEDGWGDDSENAYRMMPARTIAKENVDFVISINGSPSSVGKQQERMEVFSNLVKDYNFPLVYVNQVGGNDELIFDGNSFVMSFDGECVATLKEYAEDVQEIEFKKGAGFVKGDVNEDGEYYQIILDQILLGLRDYIKKCGFSGVVIGSSGGIDSAVTLALAVKAIGAENVKAITMPGPFSSEGSVDDSVDLCRNLQVELFSMSIKEEYQLAVAEFEKTFNEAPKAITKENIQARIRGRKLMEFSNNYGHLVLSTGNKSEMSVGYATLYGDMNGGLNLLGDLYKMEVYGLAKYINEQEGSELIPVEIIEKEPSAELSEDQKDSDSLPPYPILDAILRLYIENEYLSEQEKASDREIISKITAAEIQDVVTKVDRAEFKRRQAPPIIRVHKRAFGVGRRLPIAQRYRSRLDIGI